MGIHTIPRAIFFRIMFNRVKIKKEMIANIRPTSKAALKMQCLYSCNGDIAKANALYDFLIKDMEDLPVLDPPQPSTIEQIKQGAAQTFNWLNENQDTLMNWIGMIRDIFGKKGSVNSIHPSSNPIPPINK